MAKTKTVLYIEDDQDSCEIMTIILNKAGYDLVTCADSADGLKLAREGSFDVIILDHRLAKMSGTEICRRIRAFDQNTPIIFHTSSAIKKVMDEAFEAGAQAYLIKPNGFDAIVQTIKDLVP